MSDKMDAELFEHYIQQRFGIRHRKDAYQIAYEKLREYESELIYCSETGKPPRMDFARHPSMNFLGESE